MSTLQNTVVVIGRWSTFHISQQLLHCDYVTTMPTLAYPPPQSSCAIHMISVMKMHAIYFLTHTQWQRMLLFCFSAPTDSLMQLLVKLGSAYHSLSLYNLGQAIEEFETIAPHHSGTAWVTSQLARAYFAGERFKQVCARMCACVCACVRACVRACVIGVYTMLLV